MATSDKKLREINSNPEVYKVICEYMDNYPETEPTTWKTCMGMTIKQLFMFMTEEQLSSAKRAELVAALDAIDA